MNSRQQFSPLCDLHHTFMRRVMVEESREEVRSYHACERRDCTRIFRDFDGYTDRLEGGFDASRASVRPCQRCGAVLFLARVDHSRKIETWECPQNECEFAEEVRSPSAR